MQQLNFEYSKLTECPPDIPLSKSVFFARQVSEDTGPLTGIAFRAYSDERAKGRPADHLLCTALHHGTALPVESVFGEGFSCLHKRRI